MTNEWLKSILKFTLRKAAEECDLDCISITCLDYSMDSVSLFARYDREKGNFMCRNYCKNRGSESLSWSLIPGDSDFEGVNFYSKVLVGNIEQMNLPIRNDGAFIGFAVLERKEGLTYREVNSDSREFLNIVGRVLELSGGLERLIKSEEMYRTLVENSINGVILLHDNKLIYANEYVTEVTGFNREELYKMDIQDLIHPDDRKLIKDILRIKERKGRIENFEIRIKTRQGVTVNCSLTLNNVSFKGRNVLLGIARDVTGEKRKKEEEIKRHKLESLGVLAGGIAHDFSNLLTGLLGNLQIAKGHVESEMICSLLEEAENAANRAKGLTRKFLTFSGGGDPVMEVTTVHEIIDDPVEYYRGEYEIEFDVIVPDDIWMVKADSLMMGNVISEIVNNSVDATENDGRIKISARNITVNNVDYNDRGSFYVVIEIEDNGRGIREEIFNRIFDPYFTTKEDRSGLGLSAVNSIVNQHGGYLIVESEPGAGTVFKIHIPALTDDPIRGGVINDISEDRRGKILVMDDEEVIRNVVKRMLGEKGYRVKCVENGDEAIVEYKKSIYSGQPYDVVILDLVVHDGKGGKETIERLNEIDSNVRAIVSSGYYNEPIMANYSEYGFMDAVPKPFKMEDLLSTVRELIDRES